MPEKSWWARLPFWVRMTVGSAAILLPLLGAGITAVILVHDRTATPNPSDDAISATAAPGTPAEPSRGRPDANTGLGTQSPPTTPPRRTPGSDTQVTARATPGADGTSGRVGSTDGESSPTRPPASAAPVVTIRWIVATQKIPFQTRVVRDGSLPRGEKRVRTKGQAGIRTLRYEVTTVDGRQTVKKLLDTAVTTNPVTKVVVVGTRKRPGQGCSPNYDGCVPVAEDVDCADRRGDGPLYVGGTMRVLGADIYDLDSDGNGCACD